MSPNARALSIAFALALGWSCGATAAVAQSATSQPAPATDGDIRRLTDEQRDAILNANTVESAARARGEQPGPTGPDRRVHGEVGFMIGTNGARGAYGAAEIPLGDRGAAAVSFESSRFGGPRR